ncbi:hypothetical protein KKZ45_10395 [Enterobacter bugandensis]|uniref:hypothetical protein n=1 Tax=Enterobacter TaxID=547 RepID=UPI00163A67EC|nr:MULTISPECIES: hypothetical protein [Enterobacter]MBT2090654.1 hypothetical protein [Enterobacter bugandensis]
MNKDPLETSVSEGLAKMHESAELVSEETALKLAEKARKDAEETKKQYRKKQER